MDIIFQPQIAYVLLATVCMLVGGGFVLLYQPGEKLTSMVQHFAAGVVFSAVAVELLPTILQAKSPISLTVGFMAGLLVMIMVKVFSKRISARESTTTNSLPLGLIIAVAVDLLVDGLLISIAFASGERGGVFVAIALSIEIVFLGLSTASTLLKKSTGLSKTMLIVACLTPLVMIGAGVGFLLVTSLPAVWLTGSLAFGLAALLYLVVEELLVEAHEVEETPWITSAFFIGFLCILLLGA